jgi:hypothetical protein
LQNPKVSKENRVILVEVTLKKGTTHDKASVGINEPYKIKIKILKQNFITPVQFGSGAINQYVAKL